MAYASVGVLPGASFLSDLFLGAFPKITPIQFFFGWPPAFERAPQDVAELLEFRLKNFKFTSVLSKKMLSPVLSKFFPFLPPPLDCTGRVREKEGFQDQPKGYRWPRKSFPILADYASLGKQTNAQGPKTAQPQS